MSRPRRGDLSDSSPGYPSPSSADHEEAAPLTDEEEDGEELINERMYADYESNEALDNYDIHDLAEEEDVEIDYDARQSAEKVMKRRDAVTSRRRDRYAAALDYGDDDDDAEERRRQRRFRQTGADGDVMLPFDDEQMVVNLEGLDTSASILDHINHESTQIEIKKRFRKFLTEFTEGENQNHTYVAAIETMCADNRQSFRVKYTNLALRSPILSDWLIRCPEPMLQLFNIEVMAIVDTLFVNYSHLHPQLHVRFTDLPHVESLRNLRQVNLNNLIQVSGVAVRRTSVFPQLQVIKYNCMRCNELMGPYFQQGTQEVRPGRCSGCQSTGPFKINMTETVFQNYQKVTLQESPGSIPAGRIPRQKDIIVLADLIDSCTPGEEVTVTGVYKHSFDQQLNRQNGFPVFNTVIVANNVTKRDETSSDYTASAEDIETIIKLSQKPNIADLIINSIGPSIYGHKNIKTSIAMSLFGGEAKEFENKHRLRGDINVLILGDPGTAKSQFLKCVEKLAQRAVYTTGKGASAVGLTASVRMDPLTKEWALEGGALVLADQGTCLIDEFDKMSDQDRTSIHEAMEQQSISISKAGIVCTLKARCGVIAAANPVSGRYVNTQSFQDQVDLTEPILSRFDCLCVVRDLVERSHDRTLASFVIKSHKKSHPLEQQNINDVAEDTEESYAECEAKGQIPQRILKKYIVYSRRHCHPKLHNIDTDKITALYADLRKAAQTSGGIQITSRHIESMIRMSEAHAKMHLREYVNNEDVDIAIRAMLESFISTQKLSVKTLLERQFMSYITKSRDHFELLLDALKSERAKALIYRQIQLKVSALTARSTPLDIKAEVFMQNANKLGIVDIMPFYNSATFAEEGFTYDNIRKIITCHFN